MAITSTRIKVTAVTVPKRKNMKLLIGGSALMDAVWGGAALPLVLGMVPVPLGSKAPRWEAYTAEKFAIRG